LAAFAAIGLAINEETIDLVKKMVSSGYSNRMSRRHTLVDAT
jgi:hypothetical protein